MSPLALEEALQSLKKEPSDPPELCSPELGDYKFMKCLSLFQN